MSEYSPTLREGQDYTIVGIIHILEEDVFVINFNTIDDLVKDFDGVLVTEANGTAFYSSFLKGAKEENCQLGYFSNPNVIYEFIEDDESQSKSNQYLIEEMSKPLLDTYDYFKMLTTMEGLPPEERVTYDQIIERCNLDPINLTVIQNILARDGLEIKFLDVISGYDQLVREALIWYPRIQEIKQKYPGKKLLIECGKNHVDNLEKMLKGNKPELISFNEYVSGLSEEDQKFVRYLQECSSELERVIGNQSNL
jgi:hypothetical protein